MRQAVTRRSFLSTSARVAGGVALSSLLGAEAAAAAQEHAAARAFQGTLSIFDWTCFSGYPALMKGIVHAYEALHPGVKIQITAAPTGTDFATFEITSLTAGTAPDIIAPAVALQPWADLTRHWWVELTQWVDTPNPYDVHKRSFRQLVQPVYLEQMQLDNRFWSMAISGQDLVFFYNKDLWAKAGVTAVPQTWDQFMKVQAQLQKAGILPLAMEAGDTVYGDPFPTLLSLFESMTMPQTLHKIHPGPGIVTVDELVKAIEDGTFSAHSDEYQESWRIVKDWSRYWQRGAVGASSTLPLFLKGTSSMYFQASWPIYQIQTNIPKGHTFAWDVFPLPQITSATSRYATPGHKNIGAFGAWGACPWGISTVADQRGHTEMAKDFLFFLSAPRQAALYNQVSAYVPLLKDIPIAGTNPLETTMLKKYVPIMSQPSALSTAETALGASFSLHRVKLLQSYLTGELSLSAAMDQMQDVLTRAARDARRWLAVAQQH